MSPRCCWNCDYAVVQYDRHGLTVGAECRKGVFKSIPFDVATTVRCDDWTEVDE